MLEEKDFWFASHRLDEGIGADKSFLYLDILFILQWLQF